MSIDISALDFWRKVRDDRIDALSAYLEKHRIREEKRSKGIVPDSDSDEDNPFAMYKQKPAENFEKSELDESMETDGDKNENDTAPKEISDGDLIASPKSPCNSTNAESDLSKLHENRDQNVNQFKDKNESVKKIQKRKERQNDSGKRNRKQTDDVDSNSLEKLSLIESSVESSTNLDNSREHCSKKINIEDDKKEMTSEDASCTAMNTSNDMLNDDVLHDAAVLLNDDAVVKEIDEAKRQTKKLEKLKKRESKMKELSEKLKMAVDGRKSNT